MYIFGVDHPSHGAVEVRIRLGGDAPGAAAHVRGRPVRLRNPQVSSLSPP